MLTESKAFRVQNQLKESGIDNRISEDDLRLIICISDTMLATPGLPVKLDPPVSKAINLELNPNIRYLAENIDLQRANVKKEIWSAALSLSFHCRFAQQFLQL